MNGKQQWEYRVVTTKSMWRPISDQELQNALNRFGRKGWEAVSVAPQPGSGGTKYTFVLKRPLGAASRLLARQPKRQVDEPANGKRTVSRETVRP